MKKPEKAATGGRLPGGENLWQTLAIAACLGILTGFGEGVWDLTRRHYHASLILCVTLLADLALFLALGFVLWLLFRAFRRDLHPAVALFLLLWAALCCLILPALGNSGDRPYLMVATGMVAVLPALYEFDHRGKTAQVIWKGLPWIAGAALICLIAIPVSNAWAERRELDSLPTISSDAPNVVLVIVDTLRADHLSAYGYDRPTSPNIDQLAKQGVLFDDAISAASWTLPSHASMMTGTYAHVHHADTFAAQLPPKLPTLASAMERNGYRTAAFSANIYFFSRLHGFGRGFSHFGDFFQSPKEALGRVNYVAWLDGFLQLHHWQGNFLGRQTAADINRAALHWIDRGHRPFFLAMNYFDVHDPYDPPQPWRHRFSKRMNPGGRIDTAVNIFPQLTPAQMQDEINAYDGGVAYVDHEIGRLVGALSKRGLLSNTLLIVTSDHGEALGEHGLVSHGNCLYFPLIHVPLIFRWPGHVPAGVRVGRPVSTRDIGATILALIHSRPNDFPGESLSALWDGKADPNSWPLPISELKKLKRIPTFFPNYYGPLSSIVGPEMQLIVDPRRGVLLYDWKTDPKDAHNLYGDPSYRAVVATLEADMREGGARPSPPVNRLSALSQAGGKPGHARADLHTGGGARP